MSPTAQEAVEQAWYRKEYQVVYRVAASEPTPLARAWCALAEYKLGQRTGAEAGLKSAFRAMKGQSHVRATLASRLLESELAWRGDALAVAELLERLGVGLPLGLRLIAEALERRTGNPVEAFKVLARAKALDPSDAETHFALARLHARGGRAAKALAALRDALANATPGQDFAALARALTDFAGLRREPAFLALVDTRPHDPALAELATALDAFSWEQVVRLARQTWRTSPDPVFSLRAWLEAVNGLLSRGADDPALLDELTVIGAELDARDPHGSASPAWTRFRPSAGGPAQPR
ncbi:MAG: tetratricopeptide repeat protein [Myxococcaceae bacterium]|nr:tetratricopeptide repeat protein [Myxococcaceae bacterium]MCA3016832.1 tetratricopeptide repeat protein [Myxococcaceae bacterium]